MDEVHNLPKESISRYCNSRSPSCSHSEAVMLIISEILLGDRLSCILREHISGLSFSCNILCNMSLSSIGSNMVLHQITGKKMSKDQISQIEGSGTWHGHQK